MATVEVVLRALLVVGSLVVVAATGMSAVRTFVLPRAANSFLARLVFVNLRRVFDKVARRLDGYERQDALMALFAPLGLLLQPVVWLVITFTAYGASFLALDPHRGVEQALVTSGSSLLTLGSNPPRTFAGELLGFTEAALGLALVALLITYLPSIYQAFSRRENAVQKLDVRAGSPPSAVVMIVRYHRIGWLLQLDQAWTEWEDWFVDVQETHASLSALVFFRSPRSDQSWVTAAGCVLDAAAIATSTLELGARQPRADLCLRAGFLCLRRIAEILGLPHDGDPDPGDPVSIAREEFLAAYAELEAAGVPLKPDREQCWRDFAGWRVNYDAVLLGLAAATMAPVAPWSSDRSPAYRPRLRRRSPS